jgi:hypothetical protein
VVIMGAVRILVATAFALTASCLPGVTSNKGGGDDQTPVDASTKAIDGGSGGPHWTDAALHDGAMVACVEPQTGYGNGQHNTGKDCLGSCHNHGFTVAGTVYESATDNTGYAGATVTIVDKNGTSIPLVVQANGNFYTTESVAFPVTVTASNCPYAASMTAAASTGACNSCHAQSGGTAGQIHLP